MIISKDKFVKIINRLKNYSELQDKINNLFEDFIDNKEQDFCNAGSICIGHESVVIDLLEKMFETDLISWWIYELDYGKQYIPGCLQKEEDGKIVDIDISTADKLYDVLIESLKGRIENDR